jgi:DNA-binding NtrC family response regulator
MSPNQFAASRRLLVVDPCPECTQTLPRLQVSGWVVHCCRLEDASGTACDVGLMRLHHRHLERPEPIKELIRRSGTEWIAVVGADVLSNPEVGNFVGEWFFDYHTLPFDVERVNVALGRAFGMARLRGKLGRPGQLPLQELLGGSRSIRELRRLLERIGPTDAPVLIRGESGTGKELVAGMLHRLSRRRDRAFVAVNCGAIPEHLIQSEMFGHEKGAFTGAHQRKIGRIEAADGGTLFLDEIGDLPLELQANLLRFLQEMKIERVGSNAPIPVDVRVLAATHIDLEQAVVQRRFREDLYYRLNVLQVQTTSLRERPVDIHCLAEHFARRYAQESGRRPRQFSEASLLAMLQHSWPGNVRELTNRVRRGLLAEGRRIEPGDLGLTVVERSMVALPTLEQYKLQAEQQALREVLGRHANNLTLAARTLGISRPTFYRLLHKHGFL